jgi:glycosyltransferase involved in cell wall biosynthesis
MRILHVNPSLNPADGGPPEATRTLTAALLAQGHAVEIATLDAPDSPWLGSFPCTVHALGPGRFGKYRYCPAFPRWLEANATDFDIVVVHGIFQYHALATRAVLRRLGRPYVLFIHGALDPWFKRRYPLKHAKKWLYWPWGDYRVVRDAARVLLTTDEERLLARQSFWLYRANETVVSFGTADPPPEANGEQVRLFHAAFPALRNRRFLLFLSRIDEKKGCRLLLESFARVAHQDPELLLVMAGPNSSGLRPGLEHLATAHGIHDRIVWTGTVNGAAKWGAYRAAEAFVLTSHSENFGIVVAEALACGTPVLISKRVNIWREVVSAKAGLVADDELEASMSMLTDWMTRDTDSRRAMATRARKLFLARFEMSTASQRIATELESVLQQCPSLR